MASERKTQGTKLMLLGLASPAVYGAIANVKAISGIGGQKGDIDITNFDSTAKEFLTGLEDPGQVQCDVNFSPDQATHVELWALKNSGVVRTWRVRLSGSSPYDYFQFEASVQQFQINLQTDDVIRATLTLRITGSITLGPP